MNVQQQKSVAALLDNLPEDWGFLVCTFPMAEESTLNCATNLSTKGALTLVSRLGEELSKRSLRELMEAK